MKGKLGLIAIIAAILLVPFVMGAAVTPTCTIGGSSPTAGSETDNNTLEFTVTPLTGYNASNATLVISPHNGTSAGVFIEEENATSFLATWTNLDDASYNLSATMAYDNNTEANAWTNFTQFIAVCTSRQYTVDTTEGGVVAPVAQEVSEEIAERKWSLSNNTLIIGLVIVIIVLLGLKKK